MLAVNDNYAAIYIYIYNIWLTNVHGDLGSLVAKVWQLSTHHMAEGYECMGLMC